MRNCGILEALESRRLLSGLTLSLAPSLPPLPVLSPEGRLTINGTNGDDTIILFSDSTRIELIINDNSQWSLNRSEVTAIEIFGRWGNDTITVNGDAPVTLHGGLGDDTLNAGAGDDLIYGGEGNDVIRAGAGDDVVYAKDNNDLVYGGAGNDLLHGNGKSDTLYGEDGIDTIYGDAGDDRAFGGGKADSIIGGVGNDTLTGGAGNDTLLGGEEGGSPSLFDGDDVLDVEGDAPMFADVVYPGNGANTVYTDDNDTVVNLLA